MRVSWRIMAKRFLTLGACAMLPLLALPAISAAQSPTGQKPGNPAPCQPAKSTSDKPCPSSSDTKHPSTADQFPFPGEPESSAPGAPVPNAPTPASPNTPHPSAASEHPFPGDAEPPDANSSSSSSSSSSSADNAPATSPSDDHPWDDKGDNPRAARKKLPKVQNLQSDEDRAVEDLKVAKFYEGTGNLDAAYMRAKDAVKYQPNDPDTHFALAHIAQKMNKRDEAIAEFNTYLKLDPDGVQIKQAQKALAQLQRPK
jgi:hypothetical protein